MESVGRRSIPGGANMLMWKVIKADRLTGLLTLKPSLRPSKQSRATAAACGATNWAGRASNTRPIVQNILKAAHQTLNLNL